MSFGSEVFLDSIISAICYLYICVSEYFSDVCGFLANVIAIFYFLLSVKMFGLSPPPPPPPPPPLGITVLGGP